MISSEHVTAKSALPSKESPSDTEELGDERSKEYVLFSGVIVNVTLPCIVLILQFVTQLRMQLPNM